MAKSKYATAAVVWFTILLLLLLLWLLMLLLFQPFSDTIYESFFHSRLGKIVLVDLIFFSIVRS
jgi:hypothetical protein